jgi:predicted  nucleic acid-binding Zn-ribbon protein
MFSHTPETAERRALMKDSRLIEKDHIRRTIETYLTSNTKPLCANEVFYRARETCTYHLATVVCDFLNREYPLVHLDPEALTKAIQICDNRKRADALRELVTVYFDAMMEKYGHTLSYLVSRRIDELFGHHTDFQHIDFGRYWAVPYQHAPVGSILVLSDDPDRKREIIYKLPDELEDDVEYCRVTGAGIFTINLEPAFDDDPYFIDPYEDESYSHECSSDYDHDAYDSNRSSCEYDCQYGCDYSDDS